MRLKQKVALLLAGVVTIGSVGFMNPVEVRAEGATNTFTLTVPADTSITTSGWNDIGSVGVSNVSIAADKKISVTIGGGATGRTLKKTGDESKTVGYEIKKGNATTNEAFGTSLDFTANGTQTIGADVSSFTGKPAGNYTDTITFTAKLKDKVTALTMTNEKGNTLSAADLGEASEFTVGDKTYYAYNDFIKKTSGSNWQNAMDFVEMLNDNEYGGHKDWILINDAAIDGSIYKSAIGKAWQDNYSRIDRGVVDNLWSSVVLAADTAFYFNVNANLGSCSAVNKSDSYSYCGFLVLRGSSNASAAQGVEYTLTGSAAYGKKLTSTDLLASTNKTTFTYGGTTYTAYNGYISETSGANWNDGVAFVEALNAKEIDGRTGGWTLLTSKEMAYAWWLTTDSAANKGADKFGAVNRVWTGGSDDDGGYCAGCDMAAFAAGIVPVETVRVTLWQGTQDKSKSFLEYGFVVLRGPSNASAPAPVTYTRAGKEALSSANLGEPTSWTYNTTTYQVYNAFIPFSSGSSWNDATGFINALNTANYDGYSDWTLLSSKEMATGWYNKYANVAEPVNRGSVDYLWSPFVGPLNSYASRLDCRRGDLLPDEKSNAGSNYGFVVLRGSSNASAPTEVTYTRTDGSGELSSANLGTATTWTYNGVTYDVYNEFIPYSSTTSWNDAMGFVDALREANYDGHNDWDLLSSDEMAKAWCNQYKSVHRGSVDYLWLSVVTDNNNTYRLDCNRGCSAWGSKLSADPKYGFVVLRGSSNASAPVTYNKTNSTGTLSSESLGTATSWTYDSVTYDVYNEFIPSSKGSSWNDATGFINALNTANYDGHSDWTLLSSQAMATAYRTGAMPSERGDVASLWSSFDEGAEDQAYFLTCNTGLWKQNYKYLAPTDYGFVVLRGSSNASAPVTYNKTNSTGTLSSEYLGTATTWTYNGMTYDVYNGFIPHSLDTSWTDAMGFINALNTANYDGHNDWTLLSSQEMATAYAQNGTGVMPSDRGGVIFLWSSVPCNDLAYCLRCDYNVQWQYGDKSSSSGNGFVVLRRSSN